MDTVDPDDPDHQAAQLACYTLRCNGFEIDLCIADESGVRISAHKTSARGQFMLRRGFKDLE